MIIKSTIKLTFLVIFITIFFLAGCKPTQMEFEIYTSDFQLASTEQIVQVPLTVKFDLLGEDTENLIPKAKQVVSHFLNKKAEYTMSKGDFGDVMVINCTIPMSTQGALDEYLKKNNRPIALIIKNGTVTVQKTQYFSKLKKELGGVHMMLGAQLPAKSTVFRFVGDVKEGPEINATAVFLDSKPILHYNQNIGRRDSFEIEFKGGSDSVYSEIPIHFIVNFK